MDSKKEPASEAKERIKKDAKAYSVKINCIDGTATFDYIMGATAEYNRAQEEITRLKAELEREREDQEVSKYKAVIEKLLLSAGYALHESIIEEAKKLIKP